MDALLRLGIASSIDLKSLSESTISSMRSHIKTLQRNNVDITFESLTNNTVETLNRLRDTKGKPLNRAYKRQIAMTIKRLYPSVDINIKPFSRHEQKPTTRLMSGNFIQVIGEIVNRAAIIIKSIYSKDIFDLSIYDTCLAILLTTSTSLRIQEVHDLRLIHIEAIRSDRPISIRSKGYQNLRRVALNDLLNNVFVAITRQRPKVETAIRKEAQPKLSQKHQSRFDNGYIIITSIDFMRKKLRELSSGIKDIDPSQSFGFNTFRKYITTVLVENGGQEIAQTMNNHSSVATTMDHYNVVSSAGAQKSYDSLFRMMDRLGKREDSGGSPQPSSSSVAFPETPAAQPTDVELK